MTHEQKSAIVKKAYDIFPWAMAVLTAIVIFNSVGIKLLYDRSQAQARQDRAAQIVTAKTAHAACLRSKALGPVIIDFYAYYGATINPRTHKPFFPESFLESYRRTLPKTCN